MALEQVEDVECPSCGAAEFTLHLHGDNWNRKEPLARCADCGQEASADDQHWWFK